MSLTLSTLTVDVLPRLTAAPKNGISIYQAANSVQSLVYKYLMNRGSDLLALGNLFLIVPSYDYMCPLPSDFVAMAEKPRAVNASLWLSNSVWMAGTVVSYNTVTKVLVLNVTVINGSGTLASWYVAVGALPGYPVETLDTSSTSVVVGLGSKTLTTNTALSLVPGQNVIVSNLELPTDSESRATMEPEFLNSDDYDDNWWLNCYSVYHENWVNAQEYPRWYKVIGNNLYIRPKLISPIMVTGRYTAKPSTLTLPTDVLPWNGLFYEVFKEGVVLIITKQISVPDSDPAFMVMFRREMDSVITSRYKPLSRRRMHRGDWL